MKQTLFTIPNFITLMNLLCGATAAVVALTGGSLTLSFWLIVAAAVFDFFDGFAARMLRQYSDIGVQLDSLSDMVSFGFAPAAILIALYADADAAWLQAEGYELLRLTPLVVTLFSALRLAKFNVDPSQHEEFEGLPTPASALFFASIGVIAESTSFMPSRELIIGLSMLFAVLLVCPVRMFSFKFKSFGIRENLLRYIFILASVAIIIFAPIYSVASIIVLYIAVSVVRWLIGGRSANK